MSTFETVYQLASNDQHDLYFGINTSDHVTGFPQDWTLALLSPTISTESQDVPDLSLIYHDAWDISRRDSMYTSPETCTQLSNMVNDSPIGLRIMQPTYDLQGSPPMQCHHQGLSQHITRADSFESNASDQSTASSAKSTDSCCVRSAERKTRRIERRRVQNRESQRRYRAGREAKIKTLDEHNTTLGAQLVQLELRNKELQQTVTDLRDKLAALCNFEKDEDDKVKEESL